MPIERPLTYILNAKNVHRFFVTGRWEPDAPEIFFGSDQSSTETAWQDAVMALKTLSFHWSLGIAQRKTMTEKCSDPIHQNKGFQWATEEDAENGDVIFLGSSRLTVHNPPPINLSGNDFTKLRDQMGRVLIGIRLGRKRFVKPLEALQQIESRLGPEIPIEVCYAILKAWDSLATPENGRFFDSDIYRTALSQAVYAGVHGISHFFPHAHSASPCDLPLTNQKVMRAAKALIALSARYVQAPDPNSLEAFIQGDPNLAALRRPTDTARIVLAAGKILVRSDDWFSSPDAKIVAEMGTPLHFFPWMAIAAAESMTGKPPIVNLGYGPVSFSADELLPSHPINAYYDTAFIKTKGSHDDLMRLMKGEITSEITRSRYLQQALELKVGGIPPEAAKAFFGKGIRIDNVLDVGADLVLREETISILKSIADHFIREAETEPQYAPYGGFRIPIPPALKHVLVESEINQAGENEAVWITRAMAQMENDFKMLDALPDEYEIFAYPDRLWVRVINALGEKGYVFEWRPDRPMRHLLFSDNFMIFNNALLAGIWHDLRVSGGEAFLQKRSDTGKNSENECDVRKSKKSNSQRRAQRLLPRIRGRLLELDGQVEWGTESDREVIHRCIHGVSGHIRLLPENWTPSAAAKARAAEFGVMLPANSRMTFVQPHIRGRSKEDSGLQPRAVIKAKALATLSAVDLKSRP